MSVIIRMVIRKMSKIAKGYSVGSVLERASYAKTSSEKTKASNKSVLELSTYNGSNNAKGSLWRRIIKKK